MRTDNFTRSQQETGEQTHYAARIGGFMQFTAKVLKVLMCVALGLALSDSVFAWNDRGHMTVAFIAYKQLTPTTRDRVNALLHLNPKYGDWSATVDSHAPAPAAV